MLTNKKNIQILHAKFGYLFGILQQFQNDLSLQVEYSFKFYGSDSPTNGAAFKALIITLSGTFSFVKCRETTITIA